MITCCLCNHWMQVKGERIGNGVCNLIQKGCKSDCEPCPHFEATPQTVCDLKDLKRRLNHIGVHHGGLFQEVKERVGRLILLVEHFHPYDFEEV